MKTVVAAAMLLAIGLAGSGCKRSPSLVGKWTGTMQGMAGTFEFTADEKVTVSVTTVGGQINLLGNYKVTGDEFTIELTDVQTPGLDAQKAGMVKQSLASVLNKPSTMTIAFASPDEVSFTEKKAAGAKPPSSDKKASGTSTPAAAAAPSAMTLKRVKEST
jgi:hypothetical protein